MQKQGNEAETEVARWQQAAKDKREELAQIAVGLAALPSELVDAANGDRRKLLARLQELSAAQQVGALELAELERRQRAAQRAVRQAAYDTARAAFIAADTQRRAAKAALDLAANAKLRLMNSADRVGESPEARARRAQVATALAEAEVEYDFADREARRCGAVMREAQQALEASE